MLSQEEIYLLMRMIEQTYQCRICIIDGNGNYLFTTCFPDIDTTHLSELCKKMKSLPSPLCRDCDEIGAKPHGERIRSAFYKICSYGCMEIVGTVSIPGIRSFQIFGGIFKPRSDLPPNALVYSRKIHSAPHGFLRELSDAEYTQLPVVWNMLVRELTLFLKEKMMENEARFDPEKVIRDYINGGFRRDLSLSELASKLGWSDSHTTVRIRQIFGKSFIQLLCERRIENVKWLLSNKFEASCFYIAKVSGFHSAPYFFKVFRKYTGMTPKEYRETLKKKKAELIEHVDPISK